MIYTFGAFVKLGKRVVIDNKKRTKNLFAELQKLLQPFGFSLSENHKKRIEFYTAQSAITNHWFCTLRGSKPTASEVQNALYLGAFTPVMDDLMDDEIVPFETLLEQKSNDSADAVLFQYLLQKLELLLQKNVTFKNYFQQAHLAQNESLKQLEKTPLSASEIEKISQQKGGFYTLLYRAVLQNDLRDFEEESIYKLGGILQFSNDLFDMHKDFHNGVQTLTTNEPDIAFLRQKFNEYLVDFKEDFWQMPYRAADKKSAFAAIMAIVGRTEVALDYYQKLQGKNPKINIANFARKPLIVDMEKPANIWRNLKKTQQEIKNIP